MVLEKVSFCQNQAIILQTSRRDSASPSLVVRSPPSVIRIQPRITEGSNSPAHAPGGVNRRPAWLGTEFVTSYCTVIGDKVCECKGIRREVVHHSSPAAFCSCRRRRGRTSVQTTNRQRPITRSPVAGSAVLWSILLAYTARPQVRPPESAQGSE